ncbi:MAG: thioredoxin family protein [Oscillospiraceae bacterium]
MKFLGLAKKKEEAPAQPLVPKADALILVLGDHCPNCSKLLSNTREALAALNVAVPVDYVSDIEKIAAFGVMGTPALVVNGRVIFSGRVPKPAPLSDILRQELTK